MRLLLAVDSITTLNILLDEVEGRSWPKGTEARVLSVVEDGEIPFEMWPEGGYGVAAVRQEMRRREEQIRALAAERLRAIGMFTEVTIMRGNPKELIPLASRKWTTDLILLRAHNHADFKDWVLGSVAKSIVENAPCSVEVIRGANRPHSSDDKSVFKILLATDGSDASLNASRVIAQAKWLESTEVKVVSVVNPAIYSLEEIGFCRDEGTKRAHRAIGQAIQALKKAPLKITGEVIAGRIARAIVDRARNWGADLIVLAAHDQRGVKRLFFGNTATAIAKRAPCSVRVVRGRGRSQSEEAAHRRSSESPLNAKKIYKAIRSRSAA